MATPVWYVDGRTIRTKAEMTRGITNPFLNTADLRNLNDIIYQVIYGVLAGTPTGALNVYNGMTGIVTPTSYDITLGGSLTQDTTIDGSSNSYVFNFDNMSEFNVISEGLSLTASSSFNLQTPDIGTATNGDVLTLVDNLTGECEWQPIPPVAIEVANGLHIDGVSGAVYLGGDLVEDTTIEGGLGTFKLRLNNLLEFNVLSENITLNTQNQLYIKTLDTQTLVAKDGYIMRLVNVTTGEAEFKANNVHPITNTAVNITLDFSHHTVLATTGGGNINVSLPDATLNNGLTYVIKQIGAGTTSIASASQNIYNTASVASIGTVASGETVTLQAHSLSNLWYVI